MGVLEGLSHGFSIALQSHNLFYCFLGCLFGTITGVLPGVGPIGAMVILFPFTLGMETSSAMIMMAGIYYGAMYGGSTTSILVNMPGEAASIVTCLEGYAMARKGRAGAALCVAAVGSWIAGTIGVVGLMLVAPQLAGVAIKFGPPEFLAIGVVGLLLLAKLTGRSLLKSTIMILLGLAVATVGFDPVSYSERFTFGIRELGQGIDLLPVGMGLFGIAEVIRIARKPSMPEVRSVRLRDLLPNRSEWQRSLGPILRGSVIGFPIGLLPGPAHVIASFTSYFIERRMSRHPEEWGNGAIEGVAGPESANNAAVGGAYIPLMCLGVPFTPALAIVLGAMMVHGVAPGPTMIQDAPDVFWSLIASMYVGNCMLLVLNLPLINLFVRVLKVPYYLLLPSIVVISLVGVYAVNTSYLDLIVLAITGLVGFVLAEVGFEPAPMVIALVIGRMLETALRQSLRITGGAILPLIVRPIAGSLYVIGVLALLLPYLLKALQKWRASS